MNEEPAPAGFEIGDITHDLHFPNEVSAIVTVHGGQFGANNSGKVEVTAILPHDPDQSLASYEEAFRAESIRRLREAADFLEGTNYPDAIKRQQEAMAFNDGAFDRAISDFNDGVAVD